MNSVFLDTNIILDILEQRQPFVVSLPDGVVLSASVLSLHIITYVLNTSVPSKRLQDLSRWINFLALSPEVAKRSLVGPSADFEDNIQLHTASLAECEVFVTRDKRLLDLTFFGSMSMLTPQELVHRYKK